MLPLPSAGSAMQPAPASGAANLEELHKQAALLSKLPVVSKLLADPGAVERVAAQSPQLAHILASNPVMKDMLQPQAVSQLLQAAQDPQTLSNLLGQYQAQAHGCNSISKYADIFFDATAARQQGMRGGLERLGANRQVLAQMQMLAHNLAQHRASGGLPSDSQQASGHRASALKGPRLPLRPKAQQLKQRPESQSHAQHQSASPTPASPKQSSTASHSPRGQENAMSWHLPPANQQDVSLHAPPASASSEVDMTTATGAHTLDDTECNASASTSQLASALQQSVLGQTQAACDMTVGQQPSALPVSYTGHSSSCLGTSLPPHA